MNKDTHIIHRVNLEIDAPDVDTAREIQDRVVHVLYNDIFPRLEKWLDSVETGKMALRFDSMGIDVGSLDAASFEVEFSETIFHAILEKIGPLPSRVLEAENNEVVILTAEEQVVEIFLFFLETGRLPWYSERTGQALANEDVLRSALQKAAGPASRLPHLLKNNENALQRLFSQFSADLIIPVISLLLSKKGDISLGEISAMLQHAIPPGEDHETGDNSVRRARQMQLLKKVMMDVLSDKLLPGKPNLQRFLERLPEKDHQKEKKGTTPTRDRQGKADEPDTTSREKEEEGIFVEHAGLVILHPFLEYFFTELDLLKDGSFTDDEARAQAMHLLNYLATGQENPPEYQLVLEKYLCGIELEEPVEKNRPLSPPMRIECESMLRAAIGHWKALKNTSPDGLREGFIQRQGKLLLNGFQHRLLVESKAHDVLLAYLPWSYGVIKLPWLERPLYVEWNE